MTAAHLWQSESGYGKGVNIPQVTATEATKGACMKSLYEELGGAYRQVGDYFIPDIELPERAYKIGKYGCMRHRYLKEHRKSQYITMILNGTLYDHLEEIDRICNERMETMVAA